MTTVILPSGFKYRLELESDDNKVYRFKYPVHLSPDVYRFVTELADAKYVTINGEKKNIKINICTLNTAQEDILNIKFTVI